MIEKMNNFQVSKWTRGFAIEDDYYLIENMDYKIGLQAEEKFAPFGIDGVAFEDLHTRQLSNEEERYGIA